MAVMNRRASSGLSARGVRFTRGVASAYTAAGGSSAKLAGSQVHCRRRTPQRKTCDSVLRARRTVELE